MQAEHSYPSSLLYAAFLALGLFAVSACLSAGQTSPPPASDSPFLRLRETALGCHGSEADFTNLTEIRIGWFGPTNRADPLTGDLWWSASLAIQEANERTGSLENSSFVIRHSSFPRLPFRLVPRWSVDPWGTGVSQLARMVYDEPPLALIGSIDSASTHLAEQIAAKANLPLVSPMATDKSVTLAGVSWMFSCAPSDEVIARVLVDAVLHARSVGFAQEMRNLSDDRLVLLTATDHESRMTTREVLREFSRRGRLPDFHFEVQTGAADFAQQMVRVAEARPAAVLIMAGGDDTARLLRAVRGTVPSAAIFGSPSMSRARFLELAGRAAEGVRVPLLFVPSHDDTHTIHFIKRFQAEHARRPDYTAALTYDATRLLIEAIRRAGPNRARIREALMALSPWSGLAGEIQFDGTGQNTRTNVVMGVVREGAVVPLTYEDEYNGTKRRRSLETNHVGVR